MNNPYIPLIDHHGPFSKKRMHLQPLLPIPVSYASAAIPKYAPFGTEYTPDHTMKIIGGRYISMPDSMAYVPKHPSALSIQNIDPDLAPTKAIQNVHAHDNAQWQQPSKQRFDTTYRTEYINRIRHPDQIARPIRNTNSSLNQYSVLPPIPSATITTTNNNNNSNNSNNAASARSTRTDVPQQDEQHQHQQQEQQDEQHQHQQMLNIIEKLVITMKQNEKNYNESNQKIYSEDETKLILHGLRQYYVKLNEYEKNAKLSDLINKIKFNQMIIFVESARKCNALSKLLTEQNISTVEIYRGIPKEERLQRCKEFKEYKKRILVATDLIGFHMDFAAVNIVFNYDMSEDADTYIHRVIGAGRFGTKGLAITFVADERETEILNEVQSHLEVQISEMPDEIDVATHIENR
ncbi:unnamed protein product [Rotaria sp. Silwood1]|nr:unnamed protein product [Rotaria sp. Silwood1]